MRTGSLKMKGKNRYSLQKKIYEQTKEAYSNFKDKEQKALEYNGLEEKEKEMEIICNKIGIEYTDFKSDIIDKYDWSEKKFPELDIVKDYKLKFKKGQLSVHPDTNKENDEENATLISKLQYLYGVYLKDIQTSLALDTEEV